MEPLLSNAGWERSFKGWIMTDVAIRERNVICIVARQDIGYDEASRKREHEIGTRFITVSLSRPRESDQRSHQGLTGFTLPVTGAWRNSAGQKLGLIASRNVDGDVWPMGGKINGPVEMIDEGGNPFPKRLKSLGEETYAVCSARRIYRRHHDGRWHHVSSIPNEGDSFCMGFNDLDAFSGSDMYAVGGHGDVWRFNGQEWKRMGFPSTVQLGTVTCAGDGKVYISGEGGSLWEGRESTWKKIYTGGSSVLWNDALWFEGTLWLASDHQLKIWDGRDLVDVEHDGKRVPIRGHMDAHDGVLIVASPTEVWAYDGRDWRVIVAPYS